MKRLLCVLFLFFSVLAFAQQVKIDSLSIEFHKAKQDTIKAEILAKIGIAAYYVDFKKARFYNDSLIQFSKTRSKKYEALGYRMQGTLELIDGDYVSSEKSYIQSLEVFEAIDDKGYQGALIANLATLYARQNQIAKADSMYLAAIDVLKDVKDEKQTVNCYINLGINALNANKLELATNYFVSTLKRAEETDNTHYQFYAHNQLGIVYLKRQLYDNASKSLDKALTLGKELGDKTGLADVYNSLGALSDELKDHSKSLEYFLLSKESAESVNDKDQLPKAYINMGRQYEFLGNIPDAKTSFEKAIEITKSVQDSSKVVTANLNLAGLLLKTKQVKKAEQSINEAERFMPATPDDDYFMQYKKISEEYAKLNNLSQAYLYLNKYSQTVDSLYAKNDVGKIAEVEAKYQTEKKEKENLQLRTENVEQELATANANRLKLIFAIGLLGALLALGIFAFYYRKNKKQKEVIESLQKELHHRVKNNLSIIDTFIEVAKEEFEDDKFTHKLTELQNRIDSINEVHLQLYQSDDITNVNISKYVDTLSQNVQNSFNNSKASIESDIADSLKLDPNKSFPLGLIINEFLTNSFKHAFGEKEGEVRIAVSETNSNLELVLSDNGKGLPKNFDIQTSESFGLRIMKLLSEQLDGSFDLQSNDGVNLTIQFPK
ncbi:tetratricopeptide repeat protein [Ascidiimonas sp. W6]|uniref:tetratricopeptide repeat protein n=1 Tax=Ascidiimonas meishanensis TaxID=3128903 RepID=UPI0030EF9E01